MPGKRLSFYQRVKLQVLLEDPSISSLEEIAKELNVNRVTLYYEITKRRVSRGSKQTKFLKQNPTKCELIKKYPFCCNRCKKRQYCSKEIYLYDAYQANTQFEITKHDCTKGTILTTNELKSIDDIVSPRVLAGQSLYHIIKSTPNIKYSEQTIRRLIKAGLLRCKPIDLPRTVQRRKNDVIVERSTRLSVQILNGRTYYDYCEYVKNNPRCVPIQIDTILGKKNDKFAILTLFDPKSKFQWGVLINRSSKNVIDYLRDLISNLTKINKHFFDIILTDNGAEFETLPYGEIDENGIFNYKVFYCDPYCSWQKGGCERNHEFFRYVKRKGISLDTISQDDLDDIFSNINSLKRKSLSSSTPYNVFTSLYGEDVAHILNIKYISPEKIILK